MENWSLKTINLTTKPITIENLELQLDRSNEGTLTVDLTPKELQDKIAYLFTPKAYLGNQMKSYGGLFNYSILYSPSQLGSAVNGPDVILYGHDTYLFYFSLEQPASDLLFTSSVEIIEQNFILANGLPTTREQIMQVLQNLNGIYIRATYWEPTVYTW